MSPPGPGGAWTKSDDKNQHSNIHTRIMAKAALFSINGVEYQVSTLPANTTLNTFIRDHAHLKGTKYMCKEGGCGACIVSVKVKHASSGKYSTFAANSCLIPVYKCHGWSIKTIEALGNRIDGYGEIQARLAANNGTQCGYCSPGMVMNMFSLLEEKKDLTMLDIENSFGGNICRCTGYRPILDAFKSFAIDVPKELKDKCIDIEELSGICPKTGSECQSTCGRGFDESWSKMLTESSLRLQLSSEENWYRVTTVREIFEIFNMIDDYTYMLVGGNTAYGVYRPTRQFINFIEIGGVDELNFTSISSGSISLGANISMTTAMEFFHTVSKNEDFSYAKGMAEHIDLIANVPVRNTGTLAGNLSIKNEHHDFPSDIFIILETVGATVTIVDSYGVENTVPLLDYLDIDMNKKIIKQITLPALKDYTYLSYKIMPRAQNAHANVNAGFLFKLDKNDKFKVLEKPRITFGAINANFVHAKQTEEFLQGKQLMDSKVVQEALNILSNELHPDHPLPISSPEYRKGLAVSLLYKFILTLFPEHLSPKIKSGGEYLVRPVSSARQDFESDTILWPLNKPVSKLEAYIQCSGEAQYINDIPNLAGELFGAVVTAKMATASSFTLDAKDALQMHGVVAFYRAKDIPGNNDCMSPNMGGAGFLGEEVFASEKILFAGQALGVILAETQELALKAAELVKVQYKGVTKPVIDFVDVIKSQDRTRITEKGKIVRKEKKDDIKHKVSGKFVIRGQYHYTMETQSCLCVPTEDGMDIYPSTQWPALIQWTVADVLNVKENSINVNVRRLGGAYGCKITRNNQISAICALGAHLSKRPVHLILSLETNMHMLGKRYPCYIEYEAGVNDAGQFQYLDAKLYQDVGAALNESDIVQSTLTFMNTYNTDTWSVIGFAVRTDIPPNTWCRSPGSTEAVACMEHIVEHIAKVIKKDPISVKIVNFKPDSKPLLKMIEDIKKSSDYEKRVSEVQKFNEKNRWKKRGISLLPLSYPFFYWGRYHANISIFAEDGTVAISHGGIECGQGINTKAAQVCAHILGISLDYVKIKPTMSIISPNNTTTGGSITSEAVAYAVKEACEEINLRLEPIKAKMTRATWEEIVKQANIEDVNLNVNAMYKKNEKLGFYNIFGVTVVEVLVDFLTGQREILRADVVEDAGQSMSPQVDVGQVEGAFVMGLGYFLSEELIYDPESGQLLTDRTWNYKPPGAKDIPLDFRVTLLKNSRNPVGVLRSKATGEPPLNMSCAVIFALRNALDSARKDSGQKEDWFELDNPLSCERIWLDGLTRIKDMIL